MTGPVREAAPAKVNLVLRVGQRTPSGLHELCSLLASIELADTLVVEPGSSDEVRSPGVEGPNLAAAALAAFRSAVPDDVLPPLSISIEKRIPVAAGLGGGSADAAAVLRAANQLSGRPLDADALRELAAGLGSDVPSQLDPGHALVTGTGEQVEPVELPRLALLLMPAEPGLSTADVYAEFDRLGGSGARARGGRGRLDPGRVRALAGAEAGAEQLAAAVENDLEPAALSLRPQLESSLAGLGDAGALAARVCGSGPTTFGLFASEQAAETAARSLPGSILTRTRS